MMNKYSAGLKDRRSMIQAEIRRGEFKEEQSGTDEESRSSYQVESTREKTQLVRYQAD
jgi:hypothetical protein